MARLIRVNTIMEHTGAYRLWQAPFAEAKLAPIFRHSRRTSIRRVLDVGCGPGTNTSHFADSDYLGVDFNPAYINYARSRYRRDFVVADITRYTVPEGQRFDFILVNSLLHHIDTENVRRLLSHLCSLLTDDGFVHILDLVLPARRSVSRLLAHWDRGDYPRPLADWRDLFEQSFEPVVFEPYHLTGLGLTLWNMIYFKGSARK